MKSSYELLVKQGSLILLPETLRLYQAILEKNPERREEWERVGRYLETLSDLEKEYQIPIAGQQYAIPMMNKEFHLDYEMLYTARKAYGMTSEETSEGICVPETLSRIENARRSPNIRNYGELAEKLGRRREKISTVLQVDDFRVLEMKRELERAVFYLELERAEKCLDELKEKLDVDCSENKQFLLLYTVIIRWKRNEILPDEALKVLEEAIRCTFSRYKEELISEIRWTCSEVNILNQIAIAYSDAKQKEKSIQIYQDILKSYRKSAVDERFHLYYISLIMGNLASFLEETDHMEAGTNEP